MDLDKIKELAGKATPDLWREINFKEEMDGKLSDNLALIRALSPDVVLEMVKEIERLRANEVDWKRFKDGGAYYENKR